MDVTMPDGTVITDVPEGTTQAQLMGMYSKYSTKTAAPTPKFTPDEDTMYSPEGMPLITPTSAAEPTGAGKVAQQVMTDIVGAPVRAGMSFAKPVANIANIAGFGEPKKALQQIDTGIKAQGPGEGMTQGPIGTAASLGADLYSANKILQGIGKFGAPLASAFPALAPAVSKIAGSPISKTVLGGGALGALEAESGAHLDIAKSTAAGATLGGATHGLFAGAGKMLSPQLERLNQVKAQGLNAPEFIKNSSVGQFFGGVPQKVENFLSDIPFSGALTNMERGSKGIAEQGKNLTDQIKMQTQVANTGLTNANKTASIQKAELFKNQGAEMDQRLVSHIETLGTNIEKKYGGFSTDMINKSLEPIGAKLKPDVKGTDAIKFAQDKVDEAYKAAIPKIADEFGDVVIGDQGAKTLFNVLKQNESQLGGKGGEYYNKLATDIKNIISEGGDTKRVTAKQWHNIFKDVGEKAFNNKGFGVKGTQADYGNALTQLKNAWMDVIEGTPGAELIKKANDAHSALQVPQTAAGYLKTYTEKGGEFDPKDFLRALKAEASRKKFSAGEARLQEEALATFEQMAKDKALLKAQEDIFKQQLAAKKAEQKAAMQSGNRTAADNLANQRAYLEMTADQQKKGVNKLIGEIKDEPHGSYAAKRVGYSLAGLGGAGAAGHFLGVPVEQQMIGAGALLGGSNILNSKIMQDLIKKGATMERPQIVKDIGQGLQKVATPASLSAVQAYEDAKNQRRQSTALPVPQKEGGLVHLAAGGRVKK